MFTDTDAHLVANEPPLNGIYPFKDVYDLSPFIRVIATQLFLAFNIGVNQFCIANSVNQKSLKSKHQNLLSRMAMYFISGNINILPTINSWRNKRFNPAKSDEFMIDVNELGGIFLAVICQGYLTMKILEEQYIVSLLNKNFN